MTAQERREALLRQLVQADDKISDQFFTISTQEGTTLLHRGLPGGQVEVGTGDISAMASHGWLDIVELRDHGDLAFVVTESGHQLAAKTRLSVPSDPARRIRELAFQGWRDSGKWPRVDDLQRDAERRRENIDVLGTVAGFDRSIGWIEYSQETRIILRVQGFADLSGSEQYTGPFLSLVRLLYERYVGDADMGRVSDQDLSDLGLEGDMVRRIYGLAENEWFLLGGGQVGQDGSWSREPSPQIRAFRDVETIADYLRVVAEITRPAPKPQPEPTAEKTETAIAIASPEMLHPEVLSASAQLFSQGHYNLAVLEAFKSLEIRVRRLSGLKGTGQALMGNAFGKSAALKIKTAAEDLAEDEQEGFKYLFMGAMYMRNGPAHEDLAPDPRRANRLLVLASLLHDSLDNSTKAPKRQREAPARAADAKPGAAEAKPKEPDAKGAVAPDAGASR